MSSSLAVPDFLDSDEAVAVRQQFKLDVKNQFQQPQKRYSQAKVAVAVTRSNEFDDSEAEESKSDVDDVSEVRDIKHTPNRQQYGAELDTTAELDSGDDDATEYWSRASLSHSSVTRSARRNPAIFDEVRAYHAYESEDDNDDSSVATSIASAESNYKHEHAVRRLNFAASAKVHSLPDAKATIAEDSSKAKAQHRQVQTGGATASKATASVISQQRNKAAKEMTAEEELDGRTVNGVLFTKDGRIDGRSSLVRSGDLKVRADGKADMRSKIFHQENSLRLKPTADADQSSSERTRPKWTPEQIASSFSKLKEVPGADPTIFRQDRSGKVIHIGVYGQRNNPLGSEVDHSHAKDLGGTDHLNNLYLAQGKDNASKGNKTAAELAKRGETKFGIKAGDLIFEKDGKTISPTSPAVLDGRLDLKELEKDLKKPHSEPIRKRNEKVAEIINKGVEDKKVANNPSSKGSSIASDKDRKYQATVQRSQARSEQVQASIVRTVQKDDARKAAEEAAKQERAQKAAEKAAEEVAKQERARQIAAQAVKLAAEEQARQAYTSSAVHVRGYTRENGTYVSPHTRSFPTRSHVPAFADPMSAAIPMVHVSAYTRANGTEVASYMRAAPGYGGGGYVGSSSSVSSSSGTQYVNGYTRANGTYVAGYTRSSRK